MKNNFKQQDEINKAVNDLLEKGGKKAILGEKRKFGGRMYIKTLEGWKFYGEGKGKKAQAHHTSNRSEREEPETPSKVKKTSRISAMAQGLLKISLDESVLDEQYPEAQAVLDATFKLWQDMPDKAIWDDAIEKTKEQYGPIAAFVSLTGKYSQQVSNGGHMQYHDNGFSGDDDRDSFDNPMHKEMLELGEITGFFDYLNQNAQRFGGDPGMGNTLKSLMRQYLNLTKDMDSETEEEDWDEETGEYETYTVSNDDYGTLYEADSLDDKFYDSIDENVLLSALNTFVEEAKAGTIQVGPTADPAKISIDLTNDNLNRSVVKEEIKRLSEIKAKVVKYSPELEQAFDKSLNALHTLKTQVPPGKPRIRLVGTDSNIFNSLGIWRSGARSAGWTQDEIKAVEARVTSAKSYEDALSIIVSNSDPY